MGVPTLDIFRGSLKNGALWVESAEGLGAATQRMLQFSAIKPGRYFVFDSEKHKVLASTDTSPRSPRLHPARKLGIDNVA